MTFSLGGVGFLILGLIGNFVKLSNVGAGSAGMRNQFAFPYT